MLYSLENIHSFHLSIIIVLFYYYYNEENDASLFTSLLLSSIHELDDY